MQNTPEKTVVVNVGEVQISKDEETVLACLGLGSCIALCAHDPVSRVGGMAHIVLPFSNNGATEGALSTKYADIAIPHLLQGMREHGAIRSRLVVKLAGGARMLMRGGNNCFKTGEKNLEAIQKILADEALKIRAADVGGNRGRTVRMFVGTGKVMVKAIGAPAVEL